MGFKHGNGILSKDLVDRILFQGKLNGSSIRKGWSAAIERGN